MKIIFHQHNHLSRQRGCLLSFSSSTQWRPYVIENMSTCWWKYLNARRQLSLRTHNYKHVTICKSAILNHLSKVNAIGLQSLCYWPSKSMLLATKVNVIGMEGQKAMCHEGKTQAVLTYTVISAEPMQRWCCSSYTTQNCPGATPWMGCAAWTV